MCAQGDSGVDGFPVIRIFPHHLLLVRGTCSYQGKPLFHMFGSLLWISPAIKLADVLKKKMLLNSTVVLGCYIQSMPGHCCSLVCCSLRNEILSCCSWKLLLLLDKISEEGIDCIYSGISELEAYFVSEGRLYQWLCGI